MKTYRKLAETESLDYFKFVAKHIGLVDVTTDKCKEGTLCLFDPITDCKYTSMANGYVRRQVLNNKLCSHPYQLNKVIKQHSPLRGRGYYNFERVMIMCPKMRLATIIDVVIRYRKFRNKN